MENTVAKVIMAAVVLVLMLPIFKFFTSFVGGPITFEQVQAAFEAEGYSIHNAREVHPPQNEAAEQHEMMVGPAYVALFRYSDGAKLNKHLAYMNPDPGSRMVETWNIAQSIPAPTAAQTELHRAAANNGKWLILVRTEDPALRAELLRVFRAL